MSGKFQWCLKVFQGVSKKFQGNFKSVSGKFQGYFKIVSRKINGCFNGVLSGFQGCLKEVQWVFEEEFQRWFKDVSRKF